MSSHKNTQTVLVTGSTRGIGLAIAKRLIAEGHRVIIHGKEESDTLKDLATKMGCQYTWFDVSDEVQVKKQIDGLGQVDVLVNNAGINPSKKFAELTTQDWDDILNVNLRGVINCTTAVVPKMKEGHGGRVINIASIKGLNYVAGKPAYAVAKAGVIRFTTSLATDLAKHNILINAVSPGFTNTEMTANSISPEITKQIESIPLKRMAEPDEIAGAINFLIGPDARYITGQNFIIDGGVSII